MSTKTERTEMINVHRTPRRSDQKYAFLREKQKKTKKKPNNAVMEGGVKNQREIRAQCLLGVQSIGPELWAMGTQ